MRSKIEWTDEVWNPTTGCAKVSEGCRNCYAERMAGRFWGARKFTDVQLHRDRLEQPLHWRKPRRVFVDSMSDLFHEDVPFEFIAAVFGVMASAHRHTFQVLTKRPARAREFFEWLEDMAEFTADASRDSVTNLWRCHVAVSCAKNYGANVTGCRVSWPLDNAWLGVSVEDQETANARIPLLLQTPAAVRFLSAEPLLGEVRLWALNDGAWYDKEGANRYNALKGSAWWTPRGDHGLGGGPKLDWVICGGESGPGARPIDPQWVRALRDDCIRYRVPFFFKQWGEWGPRPNGDWRETDRHWFEDPYGEPPHGHAVYRVGKKAAGRELDGRTWDQFPKQEASNGK